MNGMGEREEAIKYGKRLTARRIEWNCDSSRRWSWRFSLGAARVVRPLAAGCLPAYSACLLSLIASRCERFK